MLNESVKPANVLTEEELKKIETRFEIDNSTDGDRQLLFMLIASHRYLNSRNAKLVHENDELMAENEKLRKTIDHRNILLDKYETMIRRLNHE